MRFAADSDDVRKHLENWASPKQICILKCFFWNPGTSMQKSMQGLLRTLIHQAISNDIFENTAIQEVSLAHWNRFMYENDTQSKWQLDELRQLFRDLIGTLSTIANFAIFIDGLDEFGDHRDERDDMVDFLLEFTSHDSVKLCLSSRPWNEFKDKLETFPNIKLEDFNRRDMEAFVEAEFRSSRALNEQAKVAKQEIADLQKELVDKSDGVFLWLRLVTRRLLRAAQDGTPSRKLREILNEMPPGLDEFFEHMLRRIPEQDRVQTSKTFQIVLSARAGVMPALMDLSFIYEKDADFALNEALRNESIGDIASRTSALRRRIDSQCMDMLVCHQKSNLVLWKATWDTATVSYLHRSVKDYLDTDACQAIILSYTGGPIDVNRYKYNAAISQMLFVNKLVPSWSDETETRKAGRLLSSYFRDSMAYLWQERNTSAANDRELFETAVDGVDAMLWKSRVEISKIHACFLCPHVSHHTNPFDEDTAGICASFQSQRWFSRRDVHIYPLMAILAGFNEHAKYYFANLGGQTEISSYFLLVLEKRRWNDRITQQLLQMTVENGRNFTDLATAASLLANYHKVLRFQGVALAAEFGDTLLSKLILEKTTGMTVSKSDSRNKLRDVIEEDIRRTYGRKDRDMLIKELEAARKSWIIRIEDLNSSVPTSGATNNVTTTAPLQRPSPVKLSVRQRLFGS
jgi:hypothetical protein